jgi:hypothetical protein
MEKNDNIFNERLNSVENTLLAMDKKIEKIYDVVVGNEEFGQKGIIKRLIELERDNETAKAFKNKLILASVVSGVLFTFVVEIVKFLIKK